MQQITHYVRVYNEGMYLSSQLHNKASHPAPFCTVHICYQNACLNMALLFLAAMLSANKKLGARLTSRNLMKFCNALVHKIFGRSRHKIAHDATV